MLRRSLRRLEKTALQFGRFRRSAAGMAIGGGIANFVPYYPSRGFFFSGFESLNPGEREWVLALARRQGIAIGVTDIEGKVEEVACPDGVWRLPDEYREAQTAALGKSDPIADLGRALNAIAEQDDE